MTDDVKIYDVATVDNREWLITGTYADGSPGDFQAHASNRGIVATCMGAKVLGFTVRISWREKNKGFREITLYPHVIG